jgi:hypothetical protein
MAFCVACVARRAAKATSSSQVKSSQVKSSDLMRRQGRRLRSVPPHCAGREGGDWLEDQLSPLCVITLFSRAHLRDTLMDGGKWRMHLVAQVAHVRAAVGGDGVEDGGEPTGRTLRRRDGTYVKE